MLRTRDREKLIHAIVFFARNTKFLGKIKLFKLLYLIDFEHYRLTGHSITGLEYRAWKLGPAPAVLYQEWDELEPDMSAAISIEPEQVIDYRREKVVPRVDFDDSYFTKRELRIMDGVARRYADAYSPRMIDVTHAENGAWAAVWNDGQGSDQVIPYDLAIPANSPNRDAILEAAREYDAIRRH